MSPVPETTLIPTYAADGARLRNLSLPAVEHLLSINDVIVRRDKAGNIKRAQFIEVLTPGPQKENGSLVGQTYSYLQNLPSGHRAWRFSELLCSESKEQLSAEGLEKEDIERFLMATFRAVPLSCMSAVASPGPEIKAKAKTAKSPKVVSIGEFERKRKTIRLLARASYRGPKLRPIEFDSQRRAA